MTAYLVPEDLRRVLGDATVSDDVEAVAEACQAGSDYVDAIAGRSWQDGTEPVPVRIRRAAMVAAVRVYQDPKAPFGVIGGASEVPMYAKGSFPDVDAMLLGHRVGFGLA